MINEITSLFNLDPNYIEMPEDNNIDIPVILQENIFESFIDQIANAEESAINRILERLELRLIEGIFIGPSKRFLELVENLFCFNAISHGFKSSLVDLVVPQRCTPKWRAMLRHGRGPIGHSVEGHALSWPRNEDGRDGARPSMGRSRCRLGGPRSLVAAILNHA
jgi:hypothetical protein